MLAQQLPIKLIILVAEENTLTPVAHTNFP
jgi:hypothetical protein